MKKNLNLLTIAFLAFTMNAFAQDSTNPMDTLAAYVQKINTSIEKIQKLKISGYVQFQYQKADTMGIGSFAGGNFDAKTDNRFAVRRGRIKFAYSGTLSSYVLQLEATEKGVGVKDAYANFTEPWLKAFTLTGGVFNRPFGFEVPYSSSSLETPERARFNQTLFPGEEDLGASLTFQMPKASPWNILKIEAGYFAGNGINPEFDKRKDFIGHIGISNTAGNQKIKYGFGLSYYNGGVYQGSVNAYKMWNNNGVKAFFKTPAGADSIGSFQKREYKGFDAQLTVETTLGITTLRGEYVYGTQPGTSKSSTSPTADFTKVTAPATAPDTYNRSINAAYICLVHLISHTPISLVVKYDFFDPNTKIKGDEIGLATPGAKTTTSTDLKYTTLGMGAVYAVSHNVKITAYYDMVKNETSNNLAGFRKDLKDNVFTLRLQYKF